jgi:hypothetical protein
MCSLGRFQCCNLFFITIAVSFKSSSNSTQLLVGSWLFCIQHLETFSEVRGEVWTKFKIQRRFIEGSNSFQHAIQRCWSEFNWPSRNRVLFNHIQTLPFENKLSQVERSYSYGMQNNQWRFIGDQLLMKSAFETKDKSNMHQSMRNPYTGMSPTLIYRHSTLFWILVITATDTWYMFVLWLLYRLLSLKDIRIWFKVIYMGKERA